MCIGVRGGGTAAPQLKMSWELDNFDVKRRANLCEIRARKSAKLRFISFGGEGTIYMEKNF